MFHRLLVSGIVLFWVVMTGLLVRSELPGGAGNHTAVPAAHVFKQIFLHEEPSDLAFYRQRQRLGLFHVQPRHEPKSAAPGAAHALLISGGSSLDAFGLPNQRVILRAVVELDAQQAVRRFEVSATVREARQKTPSLGLTFDGAPPAHRYHYAVKRGDVLLKERAGTPEELLDDPDLQALGFDPRPLIRQALSRPAAPARVEARRSAMPFNGEMIDTYLVTLRGGLLDGTLQTTQQGQILAVTTGNGYDFYDETLTP